MGHLKDIFVSNYYKNYCKVVRLSDFWFQGKAGAYPRGAPYSALFIAVINIINKIL